MAASKDKKEALLCAGLSLFAEYGLNGASTRMLANKAGANVAAISYYYGSKEGLYHAVIRHIVTRMNDYIGDLTKQAESRLHTHDINKAEIKQLIQQIMKRFATVLIESDEPQNWIQILIREEIRPTEAFDIFYDGKLGEVKCLMTTLIAHYLDLDEDSDEAKMRTHLMTGQVLSFLVNKESIARSFGTDRLTPNQLSLLHTLLEAQITACLNIPPVE